MLLKLSCLNTLLSADCHIIFIAYTICLLQIQIKVIPIKFCVVYYINIALAWGLQKLIRQFSTYHHDPEPQHDKTNKMSERPAKTQIRPKLSSCVQRRLWSDWVDAQADLSLRWVHSHFVRFVMSRLTLSLTTHMMMKGSVTKSCLKIILPNLWLIYPS